MLHRFAISLTLMILLVLVSGRSAPITTREQGGLIGAGLGAGVGARSSEAQWGMPRPGRLSAAQLV